MAGTRCSGLTRAGRRCSQPSKANGYCRRHGGKDVEPEALRPLPCRCENPMFLFDAADDVRAWRCLLWHGPRAGARPPA